MTGTDLARFAPLFSVAERGEVPETVTEPIRLDQGITTREPRRVIIESRREIAAAWPLRETPAQAAVIARCVETLDAIRTWFEGLNDIG